MQHLLEDSLDQAAPSNGTSLTMEQYSAIENMKSMVCKVDADRMTNDQDSSLRVQKQYKSSQQVLM